MCPSSGDRGVSTVLGPRSLSGSKVLARDPFPPSLATRIAGDARARSRTVPTRRGRGVADHAGYLLRRRSCPTVRPCIRRGNLAASATPTEPGSIGVHTGAHRGVHSRPTGLRAARARANRWATRKARLLQDLAGLNEHPVPGRGRHKRDTRERPGRLEADAMSDADTSRSIPS